MVGFCDRDRRIKLIVVFVFAVTAMVCAKEVSAAFSGTYSVEGDKLTLSIPNQDDYIFTIEDQRLVFESGEWLENWVESGMAFRFSEQ